jgi:iron complex transport system ATP-binding protein
MASPLLRTSDLTISIGSTRVVDGLDLELLPGQRLGILGPNGIGKTTLLKTLAGLRRPDGGTIDLLARRLESWPRRALAQRLGMLLQHTQYAFEASCEEVALIGRHPHLGPLARESEADRRLARAALDEVGLSAFRQRSCFSLSGGESRRLALASLLVQDPTLLLLDEPTNHLDPAHQISVLDLVFQRVAAPGRAALMALHDANLAACYCSQVLLLFGQGEWALGPSRELLTEGTLSRLYGCTIRCVQDGEQAVFAVGSASRK